VLLARGQDWKKLRGQCSQTGLSGGGCNFQGNSRADKENSRIFCLYDQEWHPDTYACNDWQQYSHHMSGTERLKIESDLRNLEGDCTSAQRETCKRKKEQKNSVYYCHNFISCSCGNNNFYPY